MKVCVLMIGVSRPSSERVIKNIEANLAYFRNTYPQHTFEFVVNTYINESYDDILNYCKENSIVTHFMEPIKDIPKELDSYFYKNSPDIISKNRYRMFYSMNSTLNTISDDYDVVIRVRLDTEIKSFELSDTIKPATYYTVMDTKTSCSDNIGYGKPEVMRRVWNIKNCFVKAINNETLLYRSIIKNSCSVKQFKFKYVLYQDNSEYFDGVKQWSKCNREWSYDGKTYIRGSPLVSS